MAWAKLDDGWHRHPKVRRCSLAARGLWATAHSWTSDMELDGFIPLDMVARLCEGDVAAPLIAELTAVQRPYTTGLWEAVEGGYQMHDFLEMNPSAADLTKARKATRKRVKRWRSRNGVTNGHVTAGKPKTPGRDGTGSSSLVSLSGRVQGEPKVRSAKGQYLPMPDPFPITERMERFAKSGGIENVGGTFNHFKAHHRARATRFADWEAAWETWCRNEIKFAVDRQGRR